MKTSIEIEITNIKVDSYFYSFEYEVAIMNKVRSTGSRRGDHGWHDDPDKFKKILEDGEAVEILLGKKVI